MSKKIAFLGMGAMGQRMASNLINAGHELHAWNRTSERCIPIVEMGATAHASPREAAQKADIVITMVRDDDASKSVWLDTHNGALAGMAKDAVAIECSTLGLNWCKQLADHMSSQQVRFLDAPVVGSRPQVEARQLIHLVGGDPAVLQQVQPVLETSAGAIHHIGKSGTGMAMKLAVNALFGIQVAALGELLGLLTRQGINMNTAADLLARLPVTSPAASGAAKAMASENYAPMFPVELVLKDLDYLIDAESSTALLPTTTSVRAVFTLVIDHGYGGENLHAVAKLFNTQTTTSIQ